MSLAALDGFMSGGCLSERKLSFENVDEKIPVEAASRTSAARCRYSATSVACAASPGRVKYSERTYFNGRRCASRGPEGHHEPARAQTVYRGFEGQLAETVIDDVGFPASCEGSNLFGEIALSPNKDLVASQASRPVNACLL